jgi:hypothetical protein
MQNVSVLNGAVPTLVLPAGNRSFVHIYNGSAVSISVMYDGDDPLTFTTPTKGIPLAAGQLLVLENSGLREMYNKAIYAIHADVAPQNLRVMGG